MVEKQTSDGFHAIMSWLESRSMKLIDGNEGGQYGMQFRMVRPIGLIRLLVR